MLLATPTPMEATAINHLSKSDDWGVFVAYLRRSQGDIDARLRNCPPEHLGKLQGSALAVDDVVHLPDTCRKVLGP